MNRVYWWKRNVCLAFTSSVNAIAYYLFIDKEMTISILKRFLYRFVYKICNEICKQSNVLIVIKGDMLQFVMFV